jgi:hypothetical protein
LTPQFGNPAHVNIPLPSVYLPNRGSVQTRSGGGGGGGSAGAFDMAGAASAFAVGSLSTVKTSSGAAKSSAAAFQGVASSRSRQVAQVDDGSATTVVSHDHHDAALEHLQKHAIHGRRRPR